jgi:hypothetical protein
MNAQDALKLIGNLTEATTKHTLLANTSLRGSPEKAAEREFKAARAILSHLTQDVVSDEDLQTALGW